MRTQKLVLFFTAFLLITFVTASGQDSRYKSNLLKLLTLVSKEADPIKNGISSFYSFLVIVDKKGQVLSVTSSKTMPRADNGIITRIKNSDIDWLAFIKEPRPVNNVLIPIYKIASKNCIAVDAKEFQNQDVGNYFRNIFEFDDKSYSNNVVLLNPLSVGSYGEPIEDGIIREKDLKSVKDETHKLVNPPKKKGEGYQ